MGFLDFIKSLFGNNKLNARLITKDFSKTVGGVEALEIALYDHDTPLTDKNVNIKINGVTYSRKTDANGIARLNINLPVGVYDAHAYFEDETYNYVNSYCKVSVNPVINTSDLIMSMGDGSRFTAKLTDKNNNPLGNVGLIFNINGKSYTRTTNNDGEASLNINLNAGTYNIQTKVNDIIVENKINIHPVVDSQHFGYWIFGKDMLNVNIQQLKDAGVTDVFLNYYAIESHGEDKVKEFISNAKPINVHIWMQCFYDGEWHNPVNTDLTGRINEAKQYANIPGVTGVHLDYLRYPGNAYKTNGGAEAITQFVRNIREAIPNNILLSCAVMPENETKYYYGQDIIALGQILNMIIPMQYKGNYNTGTSWLASTTKSFSQQATIWSGLQSYKSDNDTTLLPTNELANDIKTCLDNGAKGAVLFRYGLSQNIDFKQYQKTTGKQDTRMEGTNINMTYQDGTQYQCAVYDPQNNRVKDTVKLTINGVTYTRNSDNEGLYKLNINLNPGTYDLKAVFDGNTLYNGSSILNNIIINPAPEPAPEPQKSRYVKILEHFEKYFGATEYIDDALSKIQGRGYAFYFSDGYNMYETIERVYNRKGANCYDISEVLYYIAKGMNEKYGRNYEPEYLDVWCPVSGYDHIRLRFRTSNGYFYRDGACVLDGGAITSNWCGTSDNIIEVNPSWIYDG